MILVVVLNHGWPLCRGRTDPQGLRAPPVCYRWLSYAGALAIAH
jgi:hypothetical protein